MNPQIWYLLFVTCLYYFDERTQSSVFMSISPRCLKMYIYAKWVSINDLLVNFTDDLIVSLNELEYANHFITHCNKVIDVNIERK